MIYDWFGELFRDWFGKGCEVMPSGYPRALTMFCIAFAYTLAAPGFHKRGTQPQRGADSLLFGLMFAENCMKMKQLD